MVCTASDDAGEDVETKTNTMTTMDANNNYYNRNHADDELIMTMTMFFFPIEKQPAALVILPYYTLDSLIRWCDVASEPVRIFSSTASRFF